MEKLFIHTTEFTSKTIINKQSHYKIKINPQALTALSRNATTNPLFSPKCINFNIFSDADISLRTEMKQDFLNSGFLWKGSVPGQSRIVADLCVTGTDNNPYYSVAGSFTIDNTRYVISPLDEGYVYVHIFDHKSGIITPPPVKPQSTEPVPFDIHSDGTTAIINALALYPTELLTTFGESNIKAILGQMQLTATQVFKNSGINAQINFVAAERHASFTHSEVVDLLDDVGSVDVGETGIVTKGRCWDTVTARREMYKADIVVLLGNGQSDGAGRVLGIAMSIPEPVSFSQTDLSVATLAVAISHNLNSDPGITFAHELGHLLGGKHSRNVQPTRSGLSPMYDYAHAYIAPDKSYVTMMGYDIDATEILPAFSSAKSTYHGKPLGAAIDQPGAADAATLFQLTSRVMASYQGTDNTVRTEVLTLEVEPEIGGTILPAEIGPYSLGTEVSVKAIPRAGHVFKHWLLDNAVAGTDNIMSVRMDKSHHLKAVFENGKEHVITVTQDPSIPNSGAILTSQPVGKSFPYGTEISFTCLYDIHKRNKATTWLVDGQETYISATKPLVLLPEQDFRLGLQLADVIVQMPEIMPRMNQFPSGKHSVSLVFFDQWGPIIGKEYAVSVLNEHEGSTGFTHIELKEKTAITNNHGVITLNYNAEPIPTDHVSVFLQFTSTDEPPVVIKLTFLDQTGWIDVCHFTVSSRNQYITAGATPSPVEFTLNDFSGAPAEIGKNCTYTFLSKTDSNDKTGITLTSLEVKSDSNGKAVLSFSPSDKKGTGTKAVMLEPYTNEAFCLVHLLPTTLDEILIAQKEISLKSGEAVECQIISLDEKYQPFHLTEIGGVFSDLNLKIEIDDGGTGLQCDQNESALVTVPLPSGQKNCFPLFFSKPNASGTAKMRLYLEHNAQRLYPEPFVITFTVK